MRQYANADRDSDLDYGIDTDTDPRGNKHSYDNAGACDFCFQAGGDTTVELLLPGGSGNYNCVDDNTSDGVSTYVRPRHSEICG